MKWKAVLVAGAAIAISASALAQDASVQFSLDGNQPSLRDADKIDTFKVHLTDSQIDTQLVLNCSGGVSSFWGLARRDEACSVEGAGQVIHPKSGQKLARAQYGGGFTVDAGEDGFTDAATITVKYLALGNVQPSESTFGGSMVLLPDNPPPSAESIKEQLFKQVAPSGGVQINDAIDSIRLEGFATPSAGLPTDKGCAWTGDMIYAYVNDSWVMDLTATCGGETYHLQGNMPWVDIEGQSHNAEYGLNLAVPAEAGGDDALFAAGGDDALFAQTDGVSGVIQITGSQEVEVEIEDGVTDEVPSKVVATGTLTGTGVPLVLVRSLATTLAVLSRAMFGA